MSEDKKPISAIKVTLPSGRVAILREMKISDSNLAAKKLGKSQMNQAAMGMAISQELLKILLLKLDDKDLNHADKNDLDNLLSMTEYNCLMKVIQKISGDDDSGEELKMETEFI